MRTTIQEKARIFIKEKRAALGLSQAQFADIVFGDPAKCKWISDIENGKSMTVKTLDRILSKINCDINFIEY